MPKVVDPTDHREALAALVAHLGEEPELEEVVAAESQLFSGVLMIGSGAAYFLCRRFGAWEVTTEFAADELKSVEAVSSFGAQGHEVRLLHKGRLIRFSDLDEETATRIVGALEREGAAGLDERGKARRARAAGKDRGASQLAASTSLPTSSWSKEATPSPFASAFSGGSESPTPKILRDDEVGEVDDDDDDFDADADDDDDDVFAEPPSPPSAAVLDAFDRAAAAAKTKAKPKSDEASAKKQRKILLPTILVGAIYGVSAPMVNLFIWETLARDPEVGYLALPAASWALIGLLGGIFGGGLGRGIALAILGALAGAGLAVAFPGMLDVAPWTSFPALALLGYGYVALRKGKSALIKGLVAALGALIAFGMFEVSIPGPTAMFGVAIFWAIHYLWERADG